MSVKILDHQITYRITIAKVDNKIISVFSICCITFSFCKNAHIGTFEPQKCEIKRNKVKKTKKQQALSVSKWHFGNNDITTSHSPWPVKMNYRNKNVETDTGSSETAQNFSKSSAWYADNNPEIIPWGRFHTPVACRTRHDKGHHASRLRPNRATIR